MEGDICSLAEMQWVEVPSTRRDLDLNLLQDMLPVDSAFTFSIWSCYLCKHLFYVGLAETITDGQPRILLPQDSAPDPIH